MFKVNNKDTRTTSGSKQVIYIARDLQQQTGSRTWSQTDKFMLKYFSRKELPVANHPPFKKEQKFYWGLFRFFK